ncbi:hypothetical protein [Microbacterium sp.]|uniref:hypothetical protein n=1 Tax=Microbacterium sp. TaxID=51671 RepID=UPI003F9B3DBE
MTRNRLLLTAGAIFAVLLLVITGTHLLRPGSDGTVTAPTRSSPPPSEPPPAWESLDIPGYDPESHGVDLSPLTEADGEPLSAALALEEDAVTTTGLSGLSFDATELANPIWGSDQSNIMLTLSELDRPALRFGGNGVDRRMWWTSSEEPAPAWAEATVTPTDLRRVAAAAEELDASVTLVVDLGHDDPARAADMAAYARVSFGDRLLAVTIGNEPNGFYHPNQPQLAVRDSSWGPEPYQESLREYAEAIDERSPGLPIIGPGAYDAPWWRAFAEAKLPQASALSMHWYPLWDCDGEDASIANPTIEDLTSPAIRDRAVEVVGMGREVADQHDMPLWMEETGPTSCPGTNDTSRTHAQALWTADYVMTLAELGVERIAFHSTLGACRGGAPMSPICADGSTEDPGLLIDGRTSFQSMMLLSWLPHGQVLTSSTSGDGRIVVHGVLAKDGAVSLLVVDLREPEEAETAQVAVSSPTGLPADAPQAWTLTSGARLSGTALDAQESSLVAEGPVHGELAGAELARARPLGITTEPGTATLLTLEPSMPGPEPSDGG